MSASQHVHVSRFACQDRRRISSCEAAATWLAWWRETMHEEHKRQLDEAGYVVLNGVMGDELLHALRQRIHELYVEEGEGAGSEFRTEAHAHRLANLVDKGEVFRRAIAHPEVIDGVRHVHRPGETEQPQRPVGRSSLGCRTAAARRHGGGPRRAWLLGLQHHLDAGRLHPRQRRDARRPRLTQVGQAAAGCARRPRRAASRRGAGDRAARAAS